MGMFTRRRVVWMLAFVLGVPVTLYALAVAYFLIASIGDYTHRLRFDSAAWRNRSADESHDWPARLRMVDDLRDRRRLDGLTREQVVELLGPADQTSKWRDWELVYHPGPERRGLFRIDSEWLVIRLDSRGKTATYRVVSD
jgi:hypothetical protein